MNILPQLHEGKKLKSMPLTEGKLEIIKGQCGRHSISQVAKFFTLSKTTLMRRIAKLEIKFPKSPFGSPCHFCRIENNTNKENEKNTSLAVPGMLDKTSSCSYILSKSAVQTTGVYFLSALPFEQMHGF